MILRMGSKNSLSHASLACRVLIEYRLKVGLGERGPVFLQEKQFAIRTLPEKEVGNAMLAACANNEVGIRHSRRPQMSRERLFRYRLTGSRNGSRSLYDLRSATIRNAYP